MCFPCVFGVCVLKTHTSEKNPCILCRKRREKQKTQGTEGQGATLCNTLRQLCDNFATTLRHFATTLRTLCDTLRHFAKTLRHFATLCETLRTTLRRFVTTLRQFPRGPNDQNITISIEIFNLARKFQSRRLDFPTKNRAAVGGSLENLILARNFQSCLKSRIFLIFGPSGLGPLCDNFATALRRRRHFARLSLTLQPLLFWRKNKGNIEEIKGFSLRGTLATIFGKGRKTHKQKQEESENKKSKQKKQGLEGQGCARLCATSS